MKLGLFPSDSNLASGDFLQSELWPWWDVQAQFLDQHVIRSLAHLPRTVEQPL